MLVHPLASIGARTRIEQGAVVTSGAVIGTDCHICSHAYIEGVVGNRTTIKNGAMIWEGVTIGDDCFVGPGVIFTNDRHPESRPSPAGQERYSNDDWLEETTVCHQARIGAGAIILPGVAIPPRAMIPAGAIVVKGGEIRSRRVVSC